MRKTIILALSILLLITILSINSSALTLTVNSPQNNSVYESARLILDVDTDVPAHVWFNIDGGQNYSINYSREIRDDDGENDNPSWESEQLLFSGNDIIKNLTADFNITENATSAKVWVYLRQTLPSWSGTGKNISVVVNGNSAITLDTTHVVNEYHWYSVDVPLSYLNPYNNTIKLSTLESGGGNYYHIGRDFDVDYNRSTRGGNDVTGEFMIYLQVFYNNNNKTTDGVYYFNITDEGWKTINIYASDGVELKKTSIRIFLKRKDIAILGKNVSYNLPISQLSKIYGLPIDVLDESNSVYDIYKYKVVIDDERKAIENESEDEVILDYVSRGGIYFGWLSEKTNLIAEYVLNGDCAFYKGCGGTAFDYYTIRNTFVQDTSSTATNDWNIINKTISSGSMYTRYVNFSFVSEGYPTHIYVNWTNGTDESSFNIPLYIRHDYNNGKFYLTFIGSDDSSGIRVGIYSNARNIYGRIPLIIFDNFFREIGYTARLTPSIMFELRIDDPLPKTVGSYTNNLENYTHFLKRLRETGTVADIYIVATNIYNGQGDWIKEYVKNASDVLYYAIHGYVHGDFGDKDNDIPVELAESNFSAAITNITNYFGECKRIWVPPGHNYNKNATIAMANLGIYYLSDGNGFFNNTFVDNFEFLRTQSPRVYPIYYNYSSGVYGFPASYDGVAWGKSTAWSDDMEKFPVIFYTHGYQMPYWLPLWSERLVGDKKLPYHRWVSLSDIGDVIKALNYNDITDYSFNSTQAVINFTFNHNNIFGIDVVVDVPSGKTICGAYLDSVELFSYYTDRFGRTRVMLPPISSGNHTIKIYFSPTCENKPIIRYITTKFKDVTYDDNTKKFRFVAYDEKGVNKSITIVYNVIPNFLVRDNGQVIAIIVNGVVTFSNSDYKISYDYSSGELNITIPTMSEHIIEIEKYVAKSGGGGVGISPGYLCNKTYEFILGHLVKGKLEYNDNDVELLKNQIFSETGKVFSTFTLKSYIDGFESICYGYELPVYEPVEDICRNVYNYLVEVKKINQKMPVEKITYYRFDLINVKNMIYNETGGVVEPEVIEKYFDVDYYNYKCNYYGYFINNTGIKYVPPPIFRFENCSTDFNVSLFIPFVSKEISLSGYLNLPTIYIGQATCSKIIMLKWLFNVEVVNNDKLVINGIRAYIVFILVIAGITYAVIVIRRKLKW